MKWLSSTGAPGYNLPYSTNLINMGNDWTEPSTNILPNPDAPTNSVTITPPSQSVFYKITVTN